MPVKNFACLFDDNALLFCGAVMININLEWKRDEPAIVRVLNSSGQQVTIKCVQLINGANFIQLGDVSKLAAGNYFVEIASSQERISQKIIKR